MHAQAMLVCVSAALATLPAAGADWLAAVTKFASVKSPLNRSDAGTANFETFAAAMAALGSTELHTFIDKRLPDLEAALRPIAAALPSSDGLLGSTAVGYSLYRVFLKRHGLIVKGLDPKGKAFSVTSPSQAVILSEAPDDLRAALMRQLSKESLALQDVAALAAFIEFLFEQRFLRMLHAVYRAMKLPTVGNVSFQIVQRAVDLQLAAYIFGQDPEQATDSLLWKFERRINKLYPNWPQIQAKVHRVMKDKVPSGRAVTFSEAGLVVKEIVHNFGRWQEPECMDLKGALMQLEEQHSGRVRITDFYGTARHNGKWQFSEKLPYLKEIGALDDTNPRDTKVIIPNYVNGFSNCIANSRVSSVCCISECESLREHMEQALGVPDALMDNVARVTAALPSSTVPANRSLSPLMLNRLHSIAAANGGRVPLYGRLFVQWLHHLFPRECPYPHISGSTRPEFPTDYSKKHHNERPIFTKTELKLLGGQTPPHPTQNSRPLVTSPWSHEEELVVPRSSAMKEVPTGLFAIHGTVIAVLVSIIAFSQLLLGMAKMARKAAQADVTNRKPRHRTSPAETFFQMQV